MFAFSHFWTNTHINEICFLTDHMSPVKRICVFEHSVMTNFNCACPAIQRGQGSGFLSDGSSWLTACMSEQRRLWRDCADAARIGDKYQILLTRSICMLNITSLCIWWCCYHYKLMTEWLNQVHFSCQNVMFLWAPSNEFVSSSIPSWQISTAHAQPFRVASDLAFCLKVPLDSLLVWASNEGSGETVRMRRLAWTFAARIGYKYQIRLTRSI